jgi:hypothetical protein
MRLVYFEFLLLNMSVSFPVLFIDGGFSKGRIGGIGLK